MFTKEVLFVHKICDFFGGITCLHRQERQNGAEAADKRKKKQSGAAESGSALRVEKVFSPR